MTCHIRGALRGARVARRRNTHFDREFSVSARVALLESVHLRRVARPHHRACLPGLLFASTHLFVLACWVPACWLAVLTASVLPCIGGRASRARLTRLPKPRDMLVIPSPPDPRVHNRRLQPKVRLQAIAARWLYSYFFRFRNPSDPVAFCISSVRCVSGALALPDQHPSGTQAAHDTNTKRVCTRAACHRRSLVLFLGTSWAAVRSQSQVPSVVGAPWSLP